MEKHYYDTNSLLTILGIYEEQFGLTSTEFYEAHQVDDDRVAKIPRRHRQHWASFYREWEEFSREDDFAGQVRRQVDPA